MMYLGIILICILVFGNSCFVIPAMIKEYKEKHLPFAVSTNFTPVDYSKLTYLDFAVKHIFFPGEKERFYAVVTVTGHTLKDQKANIILRKDDDVYEFNNEYIDYEAWEFARNYKLTYDKVVEYLNDYFKEKNQKIGKIVQAKDKVNVRSCYYYFDTKEEAIEALCIFKKRIDEYKNRELNSRNDLIEEEIKVSFDAKE